MSFDIFSATAFAQEAVGQTGPTTGPGGSAGPSPVIIMFIALALLFYFMILRPQKREAAKRQQMLNAIGKGDVVVTSGGIHGTVESVNQAEGIVTLTIAPKVNVRFSKAAIAGVMKKKDKGEGDGKESEGK